MSTPEVALVTYLNGCGLGAPASTQVPAKRPARFVTVERVGGGVGRFEDRPAFAVQCWGESREDAEALAMSTARALRDARGHIPCMKRITVDSLYDFPDERSQRYQITLSTWLIT